jgi:hypothetical protein
MPKVLEVSPLSKKDIEQMTLSLVERFQPQMIGSLEPFRVEQFLEIEIPRSFGIEVDYQVLDPWVYGFTDPINKRCVISNELADLSLDSTSHRRFLRSTIAHESGHCVMHVEQIRFRNELIRLVHGKEHDVFSMKREVADIKPYRNPEWQAWRFARGLLLPLPCMRQALQKGLGVEEMAEVFDVNQRFVQVRLKDVI